MERNKLSHRACVVFIALVTLANSIQAKQFLPSIDRDSCYIYLSNHDKGEACIYISSHSPFGITANERFDKLTIYGDDNRLKMCITAHVFEEPSYEIEDFETGVCYTIEGQKQMGPESITFECDVSSSFLKSFRNFAKVFVAAPEYTTYYSVYEFYDGLQYNIAYDNNTRNSAESYYAPEVETLLWQITMGIRFVNPQSLESLVPRIKELTRLCKKRTKRH